MKKMSMGSLNSAAVYTEHSVDFSSRDQQRIIEFHSTPGRRVL